MGGLVSQVSSVPVPPAMVTASGCTQTQEVSGGYGHNSIQNDLELTFGLGAPCAIDRDEHGLER